MNINNITKPYVIEIPQVIQEILPIHDLIGMTHKVFQ